MKKILSLEINLKNNKNKFKLNYMNINNQLENFIKITLVSKSKKKQRKSLIKSLNYNTENQSKIFYYNECCSICHESPSDAKVITPCNHLFCFICLSKWKNQIKCCPICKMTFE